MKQLATEIKRKGFLYIQEYRNDRYAIYSQWLDNEIIAYELIRIRKNKDRELHGKHFEACESYPTDKEWGNLGWTFKNYNNAIQRLTEYQQEGRNLLTPMNIGGTISQDSYKTLASKIMA